MRGRGNAHNALFSIYISTLDLRTQRNKCAMRGCLLWTVLVTTTRNRLQHARWFSMSVCTKVFNDEFEAHAQRTHTLQRERRMHTHLHNVCAERESLQINRNNGNKWKSNYYEWSGIMWNWNRNSRSQATRFFIRFNVQFHFRFRLGCAGAFPEYHFKLKSKLERIFPP